MILAEKIAYLRKRKDWSQEELADQLEISRQSVSKWESAASIPELDKIIRMSVIFGVSTDFLLKDDYDIDVIEERGPEEEPVEGRVFVPRRINQAARSALSLWRMPIPTWRRFKKPAPPLLWESCSVSSPRSACSFWAAGQSMARWLSRKTWRQDWAL